jgi:hypothetical protein
MTTIPRKCMNSAICFLGGTFPSGIACLIHAYSNKEEYTTVKKRAVCVSHLDKQKKKTNLVSDSNIRNGIKEWLENLKYTHQNALSVIINKSWMKRKQYTLPKKKTSHIQNYRKKLSFLQFYQLSHLSYNQIY